MEFIIDHKQYPVLILDDERDIIQGFKFQFKKIFSIFIASTPQEAFEILAHYPIAVVLSDQRMPMMSGTKFLQQVLQLYPATIRILITGYSDMEATIEAINTAELYRYIEKPYKKEEVEFTIKTAIERYHMRHENQNLIHRVKRLFYNSVAALSSSIDARDSYTHDHSSRVRTLTLAIARQMDFSKRQLGELELTAQLHDVGKIGVTEEVLNKPGRLNDQEFAMIRRHPEVGAKILQTIEELKEISFFVRHHHEWFNGQGYPDGLQGEAIPLFSRIIAIGDSYDAMTSDRIYRAGRPHEWAVEEIRKNAGTQFDQRLVEIFLEICRSGPPDWNEPIEEYYTFYI
jgi:putative nucleotidyltransferase with HDIG domain